MEGPSNVHHRTDTHLQLVSARWEDGVEVERALQLVKHGQLQLE